MQAIVGGLVAFAVVVGWVLVRWRATGRDPSYLDDPSILLPAPPEGMTAATATIVDGGPATTAFMAALFDLASRDEIAFLDETPDARGAHRVGIEIHGTHTDAPRIQLNRRRPVGEGEAWLLANLKTYAAIDVADDSGDARAMEAVVAMSEFSGFIATALSKGPEGIAPGDLVEGMTLGPGTRSPGVAHRGAHPGGQAGPGIAAHLPGKAGADDGTHARGARQPGRGDVRSGGVCQARRGRHGTCPLRAGDVGAHHVAGQAPGGRRVRSCPGARVRVRWGFETVHPGGPRPAVPPAPGVRDVRRELRPP